MNTTPTPVEASPSEWMRIFAIRFAQSRPNLSPEDVIATAIREFKASHALSPEQAVERCCCSQPLH